MKLIWIFVCFWILGADPSIAQNDRPDPPKNVHYVSCRINEAEVVWEPADDNEPSSTRYMVFYHIGFDDPDIKTPASIWLKPHMKYFSVQVSPWTNYTFYVQVFNGLASSDMSEPSAVCSTPESEPLKNPSGVCVESREPNQLVIVWEKMKKIDHNGEDFVYVVEYKRNDMTGSTPIKEIIKDWRQEELVVSVEEVFKPYEFSVMAKNSNGETTTVKKMIGYSGEGVPTESPSNFKIDESTINSTSVEFTWNSVNTDIEVMKGYFSGYEIHYWPTNDKSKLKKHDIKVPVTPEQLCEEIAHPNNVNRRRRDIKEERALISDLQPFTEIEAAILVKNTKQSGKLSSPSIIFTTPQKTCAVDQISDASTNVTEINVSETVTYSCDTGFTLDSGELTLTCVDQNSISGTPPVCVEPGGIKAGWIVVPLCAIIILVLILIIIWLVTRKKCGGHPVNNEKNAPRDNPFNGQENKIKGPDVTFHRESSSVVMSSCEKERDSFVPLSTFGKDMPMERN